MRFRSQFDHVEDFPADPVVDCSVLPSMTKQSFVDEVDLNVIMERVQSGGFSMAPLDVQGREAAFGDFSEGLDYMECQNRLLEAQAAFAGLPALVRERFGNDPAELVEFVSLEANRAEAVKLGLVSPPVVVVAPAVSPAGAVVVPPAVSPAGS